MDPYYLAHIAKKIGASTDIILAGRKLNDNMTNIFLEIIEQQISHKDKILQIGISFKENVPDIRNSKAATLARIFIDKDYKIDIYDPIVDKEEVNSNFHITLSNLDGKYDCIIIAVPHQFLSNNNIDILKHTKNSTKVFDISGKYKNLFSTKKIKYWSL